MARKPRKTSDRTSLVISIILHAILIAGVGYWAYKTGQLEKIRQVLLQYAGDKDKEKKKEEPKPVQQRQAPPKLPPIDTGAAPKMGEGTRRAVVADAPDSAGDTFFQDTRRQAVGPSTGSGSQQAVAPIVKVIAPSAPPPVPVFRAQGSTTIQQLFAERAKQAASTESFGSEQISRTGVSDAGGIVNKIAGASLVDGKFAVIRGLGDRYVSTTLNGTEVPSADPYRRSASLDMFPAQIISKLVIAKTFTPDQPGTYTGGGINIVTKSFPEKPFASFSAGFSYNTQANLNDEFLDYPGGKLDWAGMDDGTRALPESLSDPNLEIPAPSARTGLPSNPRFEERKADTELVDSLTRDLGPTPFGPSKSKSPLNQNFAAATGDTGTLFTRPFGYFAGAHYRRDFSFYGDGISQRYAPGGAQGELELRKNFSDTRAGEIVNWAGMVNLSYLVLDGQELGFTFLYNQNSEDIRRVQVGTIADDPGVTYTLNRLQFVERNLQTYQLKGNHAFDEIGGIRFDWVGSLSTTSQDEPDVRFFNFPDTFDLSKASIPEPRFPTRYFRVLDENNENAKGDLTVPFLQRGGLGSEIKLGVFHSKSDREFSDREIFYQGTAPFGGNAQEYLTSENIGITGRTNANGSIEYDLSRYIGTRQSTYTGDLAVQAGYAMLDSALSEKLRLVGGVRYETTEMLVDSASYLANSATGQTTNSTKLDEAAVLPAVGLIYSLRTNMNLRFSYSQTLARPSFREIAAYRSYDPALDEILEGNPLLQNSAIVNYDLRWEWFPRAGELLGVSLFYKDLENAIERRFVTRDSDIISFENRQEAKVYGIEVEVRKSLDFLDAHLRSFSFGGNLSLIHSETPLTEQELFNKRQTLGEVDEKRPLYDQSPYILNLDLSYDHPSTGTSASIIYNISGARIAIANPVTVDTYEQPAASLDFVFSQKLTRHLTLKLTARNLLDPVIERTFGEEGEQLYSSYKRGRTFGASLTADF